MITKAARERLASFEPFYRWTHKHLLEEGPSSIPFYLICELLEAQEYVVDTS